MSNEALTPEDLELLDNLKAEAESLGIKVTGSATINSLSAKIDAHRQAQFGSSKNEVKDSTVVSLDEQKQLLHKKKLADAKKLVRVRITCNDRKLANRSSILRSVSNSFIDIKKMVPFNVNTHIPQIILDTMRQEEYVSFGKKRVNGVEVADPKNLPTFNIQEMPPLTLEEFENIRIKQQSEGRILED